VIVVSVCSLKGGVGKTSVVLGLASAALARDLPTIVVDLDPQADATLALDVPAPSADGAGADVAAVLGAARRPPADSALSPSAWAGGLTGRLDVLAGSADVAELERPGGSERTVARLSQRLSATLNGLDRYRLALLDCPPSLGALTFAGLAASNRAIVVTEPAAVADAAALFRALREAGAESRAEADEAVC